MVNIDVQLYFIDGSAIFFGC